MSTRDTRSTSIRELTEEEMNEPWVGMDFGTTDTYAGYIFNKDIRMVRTSAARNKFNIASVVSFEDENKVLVGSEAQRREKDNPGRVIFDVKTLFGRLNNDEVADHYRGLYPNVVIERRGFTGFWTDLVSQSYRRFLAIKSFRQCAFKAKIDGKKYFARPEDVA